jgi:hypothetical protein
MYSLELAWFHDVYCNSPCNNKFVQENLVIYYVKCVTEYGLQNKLKKVEI